MMRGTRAAFPEVLAKDLPTESRSGYRVPRRFAQPKMSLAPEHVK
jgi:hypothetical protein